MKNEEHDDLWQLLAKAKEPAVSPFFARNVLRAIRLEAQEKAPPASLFTWLFYRRVWLAALGLILAAAGGITAWDRSNREEQIAALAAEVSASPDYTVISHLDELLAYEENSSWLEKFVF